MKIGTRQYQLARIERGSVFPVNVEHRHRYAVPRSRGHQAADLDRGIKTQQCKARSQRVVERPPIAQPQMRRAASRNCGLAEVVHGVARSLLAVIGNYRRVLVEITEVEPAAAGLADVAFVCLLADPRSNRVALRSGFSRLSGSALLSDVPATETFIA